MYPIEEDIRKPTKEEFLNVLAYLQGSDAPEWVKDFVAKLFYYVMGESDNEE